MSFIFPSDYDSEYANLIVNHNLSYETVGTGVANKGLLPTVVEQFLKRRIYFKKLLKELPKDSQSMHAASKESIH